MMPSSTVHPSRSIRFARSRNRTRRLTNESFANSRASTSSSSDFPLPGPPTTTQSLRKVPIVLASISPSCFPFDSSAIAWYAASASSTEDSASKCPYWTNALRGSHARSVGNGAGTPKISKCSVRRFVDSRIDALIAAGESFGRPDRSTSDDRNTEIRPVIVLRPLVDIADRASRYRAFQAGPIWCSSTQTCPSSERAAATASASSIRAEIVLMRIREQTLATSYPFSARKLASLACCSDG